MFTIARSGGAPWLVGVSLEGVVVFWEKLIAQIASITAASLIGNATPSCDAFPLVFSGEKARAFSRLMENRFSLEPRLVF